MAESLDPSRCPLCGGPNACAGSSGKDPAECWCTSAEISPDVLARIPEAARNKVCVCAACARGEATSAATARALRTVTR